MPRISNPVVLRAWRHRGEEGKIHYMAVYADGKERHLHVNAGTPLYDVLDSHLLAQGYTGPKSGDPATEE
ncbi:hypothetical protein AB0J72_58365 [Dactylosporangium sp. NPDC049742]|uniref:hypothetical protein n=1 Tax=Dactylosporangium sp. NPDC049742 TaxID=3154737 RepID=UPI0034201B95